jgi:DNA invertase Pin-like site-specific DNA recombinase
MTQKRAAVYVRVSTPKQSTDDKESLPAQERACRACATDHGFDVVRVYVEPGFTATKTDRPVFSQLVRDAQAHAFEHLIVDRTDRLTRGGPGHYSLLVEQLRQAGVSVHFATEQFDPNTDTGDLMGAIYAFNARKANEQRVLLRRRTYERKARDGSYVCGKRPPYGLMFPDERRADGRLKKDRLVADPVTGPIMQHLFEAVAAGATLASLKFSLDRDHVPTPTGRKFWNVAVISKLLHKSIYWGEAGVTLKGEHHSYPPGVVEPLIDPETALVVQTRLSQNRQYSPRTLNTRSYAILGGGRGRCAHCGHALSPHREDAHRKADSSPYITYRCQWSRRLNDCPGIRVRADRVDQTVWDQLRDYLLNPEKLAQLAEQQAQADLSDDPASEVQRVTQALRTAERKRDNLYAAIAEANSKEVRAGLLLQTDLAEATLTTLREDLAALEKLRLASDARRKTLSDVAAWATRYRALFLLHEPTTARGREVIRAVLQALHVTVRVGRDPETKVVTVDGTFEFIGPLPYWDIGFGNLGPGALAETQTALTYPEVVAALAALTERLQINRSSLSPPLSPKTTATSTTPHNSIGPISFGSTSA